MDNTIAALSAFADLAKRPTTPAKKPADTKRPLSAQVTERMWATQVTTSKKR